MLKTEFVTLIMNHVKKCYCYQRTKLLMEVTSMKSECICSFCKRTFAGSGMVRHLASCPERKKVIENEKSKGKVFLIRAGVGPFWVYFEVNATSALKMVDSFLRELWLECCGHMSSFTINSEQYMSEPWDDYKGMNFKLEKVMSPGTEFLHEYDFGSTTELEMKCISEREGSVKGIPIITRNNSLEFSCGECGKPATQVCSQCLWEGEGFLCDSCAEDHECGEEMLLPVVNSPRMGVCAYTG